MECSIDTRKRLTDNVVLSGANTLFDGLPETMYKQLRQVGKQRVRFFKCTYKRF